MQARGMLVHIRRCTFIGLLLLLGAGQVDADGLGDLKHPDWHPDGRHLVAEGSCAGSIDLYLIDLRDGTVDLVFDGKQAEGYPRWFSDGKRIAFHQIDDKRGSNLFLAKLSLSGEVSDVRRVSSGTFDIEPAPSPDGNQLVFSQQGEKGLDIVLLDLNSGDVSRMWKTKAAENFPSWYPDGKSITFYARNGAETQIYSLDLESERLDALTSGDGPNFVGDLSPDGNMLVYSSERTGDREIYLRILESGEERRVTVHDGRDGYAKFSPDGRQLAYHSGVELGADTISVIRVQDLQTGNVSEFSCRSWFGVL